MINIIKYKRLKHIIFKEYIKANVFIYFRGIVSTKKIIEKARVIVNKDRIIFANDEEDIVISLFDVKKIKIQDNLKVTLVYEDTFEISLEV